MKPLSRLLLSLVAATLGLLPACGTATVSSVDEAADNLQATVLECDGPAGDVRAGTIVRWGDHLRVTANDWSRLTGLTYRWFDVDDYVINGVGAANVPTRHHVLVDGVPKPPEVYIRTTDLVSFTQGPFFWDGSLGWYADSTQTYWVNTAPDLASLQGIDAVAYQDIVDQLSAYPDDQDIFDNHVARLARLAEVGTAGVDAAELAALAIKQKYFALDMNLVQKAIDMARRGDTIVLDARRPFYFGGATVAVRDAAGAIINGVPIHTALGTASLAMDFTDTRTGGYDSAGNVLGWDQVILVNKGVTITGEAVGGHKTVIHALGAMPHMSVVTDWELAQEPLHLGGGAGFQGKFVFNAAGAKLRNLRLENFARPITTVSPGVVIADNDFVDSFLAIQAWPDSNQVYPHWPSLDGALTTLVENNTFTSAKTSWQPLTSLGSEVTFRGNRIESCETGISMVEAPEFAGWSSGLLDLTRMLNNRFEGNQVTTTADETIAFYGNPTGLATINFGGFVEMRDRVIAGNSFRQPVSFASGNGIMVYAWDPLSVAEHVAITDNVVDGWGVPLIVRNVSGATLSADITGNSFVHTAWGYGVGSVRLQGASVAACTVTANDFTDSGLPGWSQGDGAVRILKGSTGNTVGENVWPAGTNVCDQVLDQVGGNTIEGWDQLCVGP